RSGAAIEPLDGLAAVYLGVSAGFGKPMLTWADARFGHRFAGGPAPGKPPKAGPAHARRERRLWYRHLLAFAVGSALLLAGARLVGASRVRCSLGSQAARRPSRSAGSRAGAWCS